MLADPVDVKTGEYLSIIRSYDPTDAAVLTALGTVRGSGSAVLEVGHKLASYPRVDEGLDTFFREEVAFALRHLTDDGQIRIKAVQIVKLEDAAEAQTFYVNLARGEDRVAVQQLNAMLPGVS
jgi:hypothetical protein